MPKKDDAGGNLDVPVALINALLAAGLAGPKAIDLKSGTDGGERKKAVEHSSFGSPSLTPPSREVLLWARRQLRALASDDQA